MGAQGSFGRVFLGKWRETTVAIKLLNEPGVAPGADFWDAPDPAALPAAQRCAQQRRSAKGALDWEHHVSLVSPHATAALGPCSSSARLTSSDLSAAGPRLMSGYWRACGGRRG